MFHSPQLQFFFLHWSENTSCVKDKIILHICLWARGMDIFSLERIFGDVGASPQLNLIIDQKRGVLLIY